VWVIYRDVSERKAAESALQSVSGRLLEVQESERRHLASELHDEIGQQLTGLRLLLKLNRDASVDAIKSRFEQAQGIVDDLLAAVRRLSFDLRPADLDQFGLLPALLGLFERYTAQTGILVDFKHRGIDRRLVPTIETAAYRVVQEALTNAARHAGVAGVTVRFWIDESKLNLQVDDRGRGFDPDVVLKEAKSSGLFGMSERVNLVGGRMNIESIPGSGTTISVELPVNGSMA
jgi:signal transduction histidine kinase